MSFLPTGTITATQIFSNASGGITTIGTLTGLVGCNYYDANYTERTVATPIQMSTFRGMAFTRSLNNNTNYNVPSINYAQVNSYRGLTSDFLNWMGLTVSNYNIRVGMNINRVSSIACTFAASTDNFGSVQSYDLSIQYNTTTNSNIVTLYSNAYSGNAGLPATSLNNVSISNIKNIYFYTGAVSTSPGGSHLVVTLYTVYRFTKGDPYTTTVAYSSNSDPNGGYGKPPVPFT